METTISHMGEISVTIIEKHDTYVVTKCARCGGSGNMFVAGISADDECDACGGMGQLKVEKTPPFRDCSRCNGSGDINTSNVGKYYETCPKCQGAGFISVDDLQSVG